MHQQIMRSVYGVKDPYVIATAGSIAGLKSEVLDYMRHGFKPVGSMSSSTDQAGYPVYAQPMLRE